jgi:hypothetical protein
MEFLKHFFHYLKADKDIVRDRINYCKNCEFLTPKFRCIKCGCFMKLKTLLSSSKCPIGKW